LVNSTSNPHFIAVMALSLSSFLLPISLLASIAQCATVTYDFDIGWTYANPDDQQTRPVIGINNQWPIPPIIATKGDQVIVNVKNSLGNESTSLHFHGLFMNGSTHMDGPIGVTQCGILPGSSFTYNFTVRNHPAYVITADADHDRSTNQAHTGTIAISEVNTPMACVVH
jgi:iron transport multicopper oxidase